MNIQLMEYFTVLTQFLIEFPNSLKKLLKNLKNNFSEILNKLLKNRHFEFFKRLNITL